MQVFDAVADGLMAVVDIHFGNAREAGLLLEVVTHYKAALCLCCSSTAAASQQRRQRHHQLFVRLR